MKDVPYRVSTNVRCYCTNIVTRSPTNLRQTLNSTRHTLRKRRYLSALLSGVVQWVSVIKQSATWSQGTPVLYSAFVSFLVIFNLLLPNDIYA
jgi:hypothetical protein